MSRTRLLLVDDDASSLKLLNAIFESEGYETLTAPDGKEAFELLLLKENISLVITDILMPNVEGYYLCYKIRTNESLKNLPVIIYSGTFTAPGEEDKAREMGADLFIRKPAAAKVLLASVKDMLAYPGRHVSNASQNESSFEALHQYSSELIRTREQSNLALEEAKNRLEQRVDERTDSLDHVYKELLSANEELRLANEELSAMNDQLLSVNRQLELANKKIAAQKDEQLNGVLESTSNIAWSVDLTEHGETYISRSIEKVTGVPMDIFRTNANAWADLIVASDRPAMLKALELLAASDFAETDYRIRTVDGQIKWMHLQYRIIRNQEGIPVRHETFASDITSVKEGERALANERNLLRSIIDNVPDIIFVKDTTSRHVITNKANVALFGAAGEAETLGKTVSEYFETENSAELLADDRRVVSSGITLINKEEKLKNATGEERIYLTTKVPLKDEDGRITGLVGIGRDITESRRQEKILDQYRQNLDIIFSNTKEGILLLDNQGKIMLFNKALTNFMEGATGKSPMVGDFLWDMTTPERREISKTLFAKAVAGEALVVDAHLKTPSGVVILEAHYQPVSVNGKIEYITIISSDVTEAKSREVLIRQSEANLRAIFDSTEDAFTLLDRDYAIVMVNAKSQHIAMPGFKVGQNIFDLIPAERKEIFKNYLKQVSSGETVRYEIEYGEGERSVWYHVTISGVNDKNELIGYCITTHNLTAVKKVEISLRSSEERFRALVDNSAEMFAITGPNGKLEYISSNVKKILGYEPREFMKIDPFNIIHPDDIQGIRETLEAMQGVEGKHFPLTMRFRHIDGTWRFIEGSSVNLYQYEGIRGRISVYHDITERKERELEILQLNNSLSDFQNAIYSSSIVSRADHKGNITYVNDNFIKISGYSGQELLGQNHRIINSGYHSQSFWTAMWRTISAGRMWRSEVKNRAKDGSYYWVDTFIMPFVDSNGKVTEYLSIRNDITERKNTEEKLNQSRILLDKANDIANIGYWTYDPVLDHLTRNDHMLHILGLPADSPGGIKTYFERIHPDDLERVSEAVGLTTEEGIPYDLDHRIVTPDGAIRWVHEEAKAILDESGKVSMILGVIQDITQRKNTEEALREFNERYEILSRATNDAVWDLDLVKDIIVWNHSIIDVFGYDGKKMRDTGAWWEQRIHPDDRDMVRSTIDHAITNKENVWRLQYRFQCADASYKDVVNRAYILYDNQDAPVRMIGALQDITEWIRAVNEIEKLSLVASTTNNGVIITDKEGLIEWVNDSFVKLSGYSLEEVKGRKWSFLQGAETDPFAVKRISEKLKKYEFVSEEIINYSKPGNKYWVKLDIAPVFDSAGEVKNFISIQSDITELKEFEKSITSIARELASLIDNANIPIFGIDKNGLINEWNRVAAELTGFKKMEVMGADWSLFISSTDQGVMYNMIGNALKGFSSENVELPVVTRSKKHLILLLSASPRRNNASDIVGIIFVGQNITELTDYRNNLERIVEDRTRELNAALKKEKDLVQMKNQFVSIASHEFRTPLTSISMASGFVKKYKQKLSPEEIDEKLGNIEKQVGHMTYLLDDILMIGKAEAGKLPVFKKEIDILSFFDNITREVEKTTGSTHMVRLLHQLQTRTLVSDEKLLRNIVINLLTNAIKFSPEAADVHVSITSTADRFYIHVKDHGIGIPESDIKNLFEPFFRGGNVASIQGTGLGLSIIRKAVDLLQGSISVKSEIGKGTEFRIEMPLQI